jgi:hypothetical protein
VGGVLASLLRRDLTFTRRCSVVGGEDTGYLAPTGKGIDDEELLHHCSDSCVVVAGKVRFDADSRIKLGIRLIDRRQKLGGSNQFTVRAEADELAALIPTVAAEICRRIGFNVERSITLRWRKHNLTDLTSLLAVARCWETKGASKLADLLEGGKAHPDGVVAVDTDGPDRETAIWALEKANELEPDNPQLAFLAFCVLCNYHEPTTPPRFEQMLRDGLAAGPGHGKSHMVLPHILQETLDNIPYILAHSEAGCRLLQYNPFALTNFSRYLMRLRPRDERIDGLLSKAIEFDPVNPFGYEAAISYYLQQKQLARALKFAEQLLELCTPPVSERTMYCFRQGPTIAKLIEQKQFSPREYAEQYVEYCRKALRSKS